MTNLKNSMYKITSIFCLFLTGCGYPHLVERGGQFKAIDYERFRDAVTCRIIDAWKFEFDYHDRRLDAVDGTSWNVEISLTHTKNGKAGLASTGSNTQTPGNWSSVIKLGIGPSVDNTFQLVANSKLQIPKRTFTDESILKAETGSDLVLAAPFNKTCHETNSYVNLSQMGINKSFKQFIRGFSPEKNGETFKYTNLNFINVGQLKLSLDGVLTFSVAPDLVIFPPTASWSENITIEVNVDRAELNPKKKKPEATLVKIENTSELTKVSIANVAELACKFRHPSASELPEFRTCLRGQVDEVPPAAVRNASQKIRKRDNSRLRPSNRRPVLSNQKGPVADTQREGTERLIREAIEDIVE